MAELRVKIVEIAEGSGKEEVLADVAAHESPSGNEET
jgi:hypothetical protein